MPLNVNNVIEKDIVTDPAKVITLIAGGVANPNTSGAANIGQDVLPDIARTGHEFSARYVQNTGTNPTFYAIGEDCTATNYHGSLAAAQQLNISDCGQRVNCFSVLGTTVATTVFRRVDRDTHQNIIQGAYAG